MRDQEKSRIAQKADELVEADGPNELVRVPGVKSTGAIEKLDKEQVRARRDTLSRLMHTGLSDDKIREQMVMDGWKMDKATFSRLKEELFARWNTEDAERAPYLKGAARRRIYEHLEAAAGCNQYNAVASLEKTLATIEGTSLDEGKSEPADARQINAIIMIIGDMDPDKAMELVQGEIERSGKMLPAPSKAVDVTPAKKN